MFNSKPSDINKGVLSEQRTLQAKSDGAELCAEFDILKIVWAGNNVQYLESQILAYMIIWSWRIATVFEVHSNGLFSALSYKQTAVCVCY
jgi:hypothetical protein